MSSLAAAAVSPPAGLLRLRRRGAPLQSRRIAISVTNAVASVAAGDAEVAALDDGAARPLTAVIVGGGPGGMAACGRAWQITLATSCDTVQLKTRGSTM